MFEILEGLELLELVVEVVWALGRGIAAVLRWVVSPFRRRRPLASGAKRV